MKSRLARLLSGSALAMVANTAAALLATMWLPAEQRGAMVTSVTVAAFIPIIATFGSGTAYRVLAGKASTEALASLKAGYSLLTGIAVVAGALAGAAAMAVFATTTDAGIRPVGAFVALTAWSVAQQVLLIQVSDARYASGEFQRTPLWAAAAGLAGLVAMALVPVGTRSGATLLTAQLLGLSGVTVANLVTTWRTGYLARPRVAAIRPLLQQGLPVIPMGLGWAAVQKANRLITAALLGPTAVAVLALAATASESSRLISNATSQLTLHTVAAAEGQPRLTRSYALALTLTAVALAAIVGAVWFMTVPIFGDAYADVPLLVLGLAGAELCYAVYIVSNRAMLGMQRSRSAATISLAAGCAAVPSYLALTHLWGLWGNIAATVGLYALLATASVIVLRKQVAREVVTPDADRRVSAPTP